MRDLAAQELLPHSAAKQLELDLADPQRAERGTGVLKRILWTDGQPTEQFPGAGKSRAEYLASVQPLLTAAEQARFILLK